MNSELLSSLVVLALVDSTSFGTLVLPLWLMLAPGRLRVGSVLLYLAVVAGFYLALGIALKAGATTVIDRFDAASMSGFTRVVQYVVGFALVVVGITMEPWTKEGKAKQAARRAEREALHGPGRLTRWRALATDGSASRAAIVALAATAAAVEAASMLPYLGAIGLVTNANLSVAATFAVFAGYCLVMIVPALGLLAGRVIFHDRLAPTLTRIEGWMTRHGREATAWIAFFAGVYLIGTASTGLAGT